VGAQVQPGPVVKLVSQLEQPFLVVDHRANTGLSARAITSAIRPAARAFRRTSGASLPIAHLGVADVAVQVDQLRLLVLAWRVSEHLEDWLASAVQFQEAV
jgi:hypothetical protein